MTEEVIEELTEEQQIEEAKTLRAEDAAAIWNEESLPEKDDEIPPEPETEHKEEPDAWAGVNPVLRESFDKLSSQLNSLTMFETRLKQAEKRVGSIQNELFAARQKIKKVAEAPSAEQIAEAAKTEEEWKGLKTDFPEWASAIESKLESKLSETRAELSKKIPNTELLEKKLNDDMVEITTKLSEMSTAIEKNSVGSKYPEWESTVDSKPYQEWIASQPDNLKALTNSPLAKDAITVLDKFYESQKATKTLAEITAERQKRLKNSETVVGRERKIPKSELDMTDAELRKSEAKKIWASP